MRTGTLRITLPCSIKSNIPLEGNMKKQVFNLADQRISDDLRRVIPPWSPSNDHGTPKPNPKCTVWRYPHIDSIRIISKLGNASATRPPASARLPATQARRSRFAAASVQRADPPLFAPTMFTVNVGWLGGTLVRCPYSRNRNGHLHRL